MEMSWPLGRPRVFHCATFKLLVDFPCQDHPVWVFNGLPHTLQTGISRETLVRHRIPGTNVDVGGDTLSNKKLLGAPGIATRSKDATFGAWTLEVITLGGTTEPLPWENGTPSASRHAHSPSL